jgi:hypothetical protein
MPKDVWSEDRVQRAIALQERSDAVAQDTTPSTDPFALLDDSSQLVLVRRVSDGWLEAKLPDEAADLIASGEYRPFVPTEGYTGNGALSCQADPEWVEVGRTERIAALAKLRSSDDIERVVQDELARLADLSDEELDRLSVEVQP